MKNVTITLCILCTASLTAHGNGWSFEPAPKTDKSDTNKNIQTLLIPAPMGKTQNALQLPGRTFSELLDKRISVSVSGRFDPLNQIENLSRESASEWLGELQTRKGKSGVASAIRLSFREYAVRTFGIGGALGKILGGGGIGEARPSPFNLSEGRAVWDIGTREKSGRYWDIQPFRESPYAVLGYTRVDWFGTPLWELQSRLQAQDWSAPLAEITGALYAQSALSFETGVQFRAEIEGRGASFARGDDQKFAAFCGANLRLPYGNLLLRVSGPDTLRVSVAYRVAR